MVNVEPYLKLWYAHYHDDRGLTVVGVHSPKFPHERDVGKVRVYARKFGITHPVANANANDYIIWKGHTNQYWPAIYLADRQGRIATPSPA